MQGDYQRKIKWIVFPWPCLKDTCSLQNSRFAILWMCDILFTTRSNLIIHSVVIKEVLIKRYNWIAIKTSNQKYILTAIFLFLSEFLHTVGFRGFGIMPQQ